MLRFDMLGFEGIIHVENPYLILFDYMRLQLLCFLWNSEPENILIIGLGAGILPRIIHHLSPNTIIHVVEIDPQVIDLAQKYFDFHTNDFIRVYAEDGRYFLERRPSNQYDIIIVDVFTVNGHIPHALRTLECLGEYLRVLKSTGLVIANFLYEQESRYRQTYAHALFKHIYRGVTKDNYILIGLNKQAKVFDQSALQLRARGLQQSKPLPEVNWVEEVQHIQNGNDNKWNKSATIFTDKVYEDFLGTREGN